MKLLKALSVFVALFVAGCQISNPNRNCCDQCQVCGRNPGQRFGRGQGKGPGPGRMNRPTFNEVDVNKDGKISQEELSSFRAEKMREKAKEGRRLRNAGQAPSFKMLDKNGDGVLTSDEFPPAMPAGRGRRM